MFRSAIPRSSRYIKAHTLRTDVARFITTRYCASAEVRETVLQRFATEEIIKGLGSSTANMHTGTVDTPSITLLCLTINHEGNTLGDVFPLDISPRALVGHLKTAIKTEMAPSLDHVAADALCLWKLLKPTPTGCTRAEINAFDTAVKGLVFPMLKLDDALMGNGVVQFLNPPEELSYYWMGSPEPRHLHLIVQVPYQMLTLENAIQQATALLDRNSNSLKLAATTDAQLDNSNPFFVDGLGDLYDTDPSTKDRVLKIFGPSKSRVVSNAPGSGKTQLLVEGLCQYWGLYFTLDPLSHLGSMDFSLSLTNMESYNKDGEAFSPTVPHLPTSGPLETNRTNCPNYIPQPPPCPPPCAQGIPLGWC